MRPAFLLFLLLGAPAPDAGAQPRKFDVVNEGDEIRVLAVGSPAAPPVEFFAPAEPEVLSSTLTVLEIARRYGEEFRAGEKKRLLERLKLAKPKTNFDIRALLDLYNRYPRQARNAVQASLRLLGPQDAHFDPFFVMLLRERDTQFQAFGMLGALQVRSEDALPVIRRLAERDLDRPDFPDEAAVTLQALRIIAEWKAPGALQMLERHARRFPQIAGLIARHYWTQRFEEIVTWSESKKEDARERAREAWRADVPVEDLLRTRDALEKLVFDDKKHELTRHQAAIKLGFAADEATVDRLLAAHAASKDDMERLYLTTALFASRNPKAVPLLVDHAKNHPSSLNRAGALAQLKDLMPDADYRNLLEWMAKNDADSQNRDLAKTELSLLAADEEE